MTHETRAAPTADARMRLRVRNQRFMTGWAPTISGFLIACIGRDYRSTSIG